MNIITFSFQKINKFILIYKKKPINFMLKIKKNEIKNYIVTLKSQKNLLTN